MDPATYELLRNKTLLFFIEKLLDPAHGAGGGSTAANSNNSSNTATTTTATTTATLNSNSNNNSLVLYTNKRTLHDLSCQFGSKGFTKEMRQIAGGSQSGLKKFLQSYPSIFRIDGDMVSYNVNSSTLITSTTGSSSSDNNNQDGNAGDDNNPDNSNSPSHHNSNNNNQQLSSIDNEAVEYFRERLMQYGIGIWVPVKSLLGHRSQAPPHIRHVSGQHIREFTTFLSKYPSTFILNAQDEVLLKEFENYYNNENNIIATTATTSTTTPATHSKLLIEKKRIVELIEFYANCLVERGPMLVEQLFCAGNMKYECSNYGDSSENSSEVLWDYFKTPNDLSTFFKMYPQCFLVHSNLVTFSDTYKVGLEYLKRQMGVGGSGILVSQQMPRVQAPVPVLQQQQSPVKQVQASSSPQQQPQKPTVEEKPSKTPVTTVTKQEKPQQSLLKHRVSKILMQTINQNTAHDYKHDVMVTSPTNTRPSLQQSNSSSSKKDNNTSSSPLHHHSSSTNNHTTQFTALCSNNPDSDELRAYILSRTTIVSNQRKAGQIIDEIIKAGEPVSLDFEGINLGNDGQITLVQVGTGRGSVFIFDVLTQPGLIEGGERSLLGGLLCGGGEEDKEGKEESGSGGCGVVKVMHDCRNDSVNLYRQFGIRLRNVFDTQVAHIVIQQVGGDEDGCEDNNEDDGGSGGGKSRRNKAAAEDSNNEKRDDEERQRGTSGNSKNISLNNLCSVYGTVCNPFKDKVKSVYRHDQKYWSRRPLTKQMIAYASCDVMCLVPSIHQTLKSKIESDPARLKLFQELCEEQILTHIEPDEIRSRRRLRKNEADLRGLRGKLDRAFGVVGMATSNSSLVLSNREMRLLKHLNLTEDEKERLKLSLKVAKKLEKMSSSGSGGGAGASPRPLVQYESSCGDNNSLGYYFQQPQQHQSITTTLSSAESTSNSELTSLEYNNNNNNNSLTTTTSVVTTMPFQQHHHTDPRIAQIDSLEAIINRLISDNCVSNEQGEEEEEEQQQQRDIDEGDEQFLLDNHHHQQRHHALDFVLGSGSSDGDDRVMDNRKKKKSLSLKDSCTQTISTGDIVITKVFDD